MKVYSFEKLLAWQHSKSLSLWIYQQTKEFPGSEQFGFISQMRRAAISISSNIAEGSSRMTEKDQNNFYTISYSSSIELLNQLIIAKDLNYLNEEKYMEGRNLIEKQTFLISKLRSSK